MNFAEIERIREGAIDPNYQFLNKANAISQLIARRNEISFISKIVDECAQGCSKIKKLSIEAIKDLYDGIIKQHDLDVLNEVALKEAGSVGDHNTRIFMSYPLKPVKTITNINLNDAGVRSGVVHEFAHVLDNNSLEFTSYPLSKFQEFKQFYFPNMESPFNELNNRKNGFIYLPNALKKAEYDRILTDLIADAKRGGHTAESAFLGIENKVKDEALAYCKTPRSFNIFLPESNEPVMSKFYKSFYDYLLSVKYDKGRYSELVK